MRVLSDPTLGLVVEVAAGQFSRSKLGTLLMLTDLRQFGEDKAITNKQELVRSHVLAACDYTEQHQDTEDARQALFAFICVVVELTVHDPSSAPDWFDDLREALLADGYELTWELEEGHWGFTHASNYQILPTDAGPDRRQRYCPQAGDPGACGGVEHPRGSPLAAASG